MNDHIASVDMHPGLSVCHALGHIAKLIDFDGVDPATAVYDTVELYSRSEDTTDVADLIATLFAVLVGE